MANLKKGDERSGYVIEGDVSTGAFAKSYRAKKGGRSVFLKQYTSPKPSVEWFRRYVSYQKELKKRIQNSSVKDFAYEFIDFFEATRPPRNSPSTNMYYQVFEWVDDGYDLAGMIEKMRANAAAYTWEQRLTWAKVIMYSVRELHAADIVHSDLKPENLILIPDRSIDLEFQLKLIDMDFSLLSDKTAPWDSHQGYVGTPGWFSPEHLGKESIPSEKSDVFTCGLILYDLLGQGNPYHGLDDDEYQKKVLNFKARPPRLEGAMPKANDEAVINILHRCLDPKQDERPTAEQVHQTLLGLQEDLGSPESKPPESKPPKSKPPKSKPPPKPERPPLKLTAGGHTISFNITTKLSARTVRQFGEDSQFWDKDCQMTIEKREDGWYLVPNSSATNETILNGKAVTSATKLSDGGKIGVGRESKGIVKLPLTVTVA